MKKNVCLFIILFFLILGLYPVCVILSLPDVPREKYMYRNYIYDYLRKNNVQQKSIFIDSGSNSLYAINSKIMARELGYNTFVIAESTAVPWRLKFYDALENLRPGDVYLFAPEYNSQYDKDVYASLILGGRDQPWGRTFKYWPDYAGYMKIQSPAFQKYLDALGVPVLALPVLWKNWLLSRVKGFRDDALAEYKEQLLVDDESSLLYSYFDIPLISQLENWDDKKRIFWDKYITSTTTNICARYIWFSQNVVNRNSSYLDLRRVHLIDQVPYPGALRASLSRDLKILKKLQDAGVTVIWTWAAVIKLRTDTGEERQHFEEFKSSIDSLLKHYNIPLVGNFEDSVFPENATRDRTFWHLTEEFADIRTERLIRDLKASGLLEQDLKK